jgi:hypothetical protein
LLEIEVVACPSISPDAGVIAMLLIDAPPEVSLMINAFPTFPVADGAGRVIVLATDVLLTSMNVSLGNAA